MGKSRKRSRHFNTGYPYSVRVAHIHVVRPKVRRQSDSSLFIGDAKLAHPRVWLSSQQCAVPLDLLSECLAPAFLSKDTKSDDVFTMHSLVFTRLLHASAGLLLPYAMLCNGISLTSGKLSCEHEASTLDVQAYLLRQCTPPSAHPIWRSSGDATPPSSAWTLCGRTQSTTGARPTPLLRWCAIPQH